MLQQHLKDSGNKPTTSVHPSSSSMHKPPAKPRSVRPGNRKLPGSGKFQECSWWDFSWKSKTIQCRFPSINGLLSRDQEGPFSAKKSGTWTCPQKIRDLRKEENSCSVIILHPPSLSLIVNTGCRFVVQY
ncbi:hypothetical protein SLA2020_420090 [Shorea laevis]